MTILKLYEWVYTIYPKQPRPDMVYKITLPQELFVALSNEVHSVVSSTIVLPDYRKGTSSQLLIRKGAYVLHVTPSFMFSITQAL